MSKSTKPRPKSKPAKPYEGYPLFAHASGRWCKKIRGRHVYFGSWGDPDGALEKYLNEKGMGREFCGTCGSLVPGRPAHMETWSVPAGILDDDPGVRPVLHVFASERAHWWEIADALPQFEKWVPGTEPRPTGAASSET